MARLLLGGVQHRILIKSHPHCFLKEVGSELNTEQWCMVSSCIPRSIKCITPGHHTLFKRLVQNETPNSKVCYFVSCGYSVHQMHYVSYLISVLSVWQFSWLGEGGWGERRGTMMVEEGKEG